MNNLNHGFKIFRFDLLNVETYFYRLVTHSIQHIKISASKSLSERNGSKLAFASSYANGRFYLNNGNGVFGEGLNMPLWPIDKV